MFYYILHELHEKKKSSWKVEMKIDNQLLKRCKTCNHVIDVMITINGLSCRLILNSCTPLHVLHEKA
jgi:hypothetical protein